MTNKKADQTINALNKSTQTLRNLRGSYVKRIEKYLLNPTEADAGRVDFCRSRVLHLDGAISMNLLRIAELNEITNHQVFLAL